MTSVMLETVRKGYWKADAETVRQIAETHVELMKKFDLPPTRNEKLREMIREHLKNPELRREYEQQVARALEQQKKQHEEVSGQRLKEETVESPKPDEGDNRAAMRVILGIIIAALLAVILGHRRKKRF